MDMADLGELKLNDYARPTISNFPAVDSFAIMKCDLFGLKGDACVVGFQVTVHDEHKVSRKTLTRNPK